MIQKLRRKFVFILMCVVTFILIAVFVSVFLTTGANVRRISEELLRQSLALPAKVPTMHPAPAADSRQRFVANVLSFVLIAEIYPDGEIIFLNNQFNPVEMEEAEGIVHAAMNSAGQTGVQREYGLRWMKSEDGRRIAFADVSMEQETLKNLFVTALPIGGAALMVFFFISLTLARWAVRPVELAWLRQRQFVSDASHELKTPLTVILSNAEMLSADTHFTDEKKTRRIEHIHAEAARMKNLLDDMLALARADSAEKRAFISSLDFSDIVTNSILIFEPMIYDEGKIMKYNVQKSLFVLGDVSDLKQLAVILLDNACKYTPEKGHIEINLRAEDGKTLIFTVKNEGEAIPEEECRHIFQRFYRLDKSRSGHGGFGLGLSIADGIVKEHGGRIWAESKNGDGNQFHVTLPLA